MSTPEPARLPNFSSSTTSAAERGRLRPLRMNTKKPPGDETIKGLPSFDARAEDSFVGGKTKVSLSDLKKAAETAPEVSQGAWRERVFTPRAVMSREDVKAGLQSTLRVVMGTANHPAAAMERLRPGWLPLLRQALEQAGGDGIDAWIQTLFTPPGRSAKHLFFGELSEALLRMRKATDLPAFEQESLKTVELVDAALGNAPTKLSFKQTERQLEGKLEVDELLGIRCGVEADLNKRLTEIGNTMEQLRDQIRKMPGKQPDGMYANFVRLKAELRVLDSELKRRAGTLPTSSL